MPTSHGNGGRKCAANAGRSTRSSRANGLREYASANGCRERRGRERLTDASLARLTRHDTRLAQIVIREEHTDFLNLVGINVLEQALLAAGPSQSSELRRKFAQLARLAIQHPGAVARLMQMIEAHHDADQRWRENQKLGQIVEELIQMRLKSHLSLFRIRVQTPFKGYDLGAYADDPSSSDVGSIEVSSPERFSPRLKSRPRAARR